MIGLVVYVRHVSLRVKIESLSTGCRSVAWYLAKSTARVGLERRLFAEFRHAGTKLAEIKMGWVSIDGMLGVDRLLWTELCVGFDPLIRVHWECGHWMGLVVPANYSVAVVIVELVVPPARGHCSFFALTIRSLRHSLLLHLLYRRSLRTSP